MTPTTASPANGRQILIENGVVAGNVTDKYSSGNPVHRWLMSGFLQQAESFVRRTGCTDLYEAGCGEGLLSLTLAGRIPGLQIKGSDFSEAVVKIAQKNTAKNDDLQFSVADIYSLDPREHSADLVLCCEVLEHLEEPDVALKVLRSLARKYLILSVPNEPLWRILNTARGKYLSAWGNTPGHLNHWSPSAFRCFLETELIIEDLRCPLPWTMALARPR
jgi:2-polyprenyl-3-methyl-5-hydroxy-6-metoxy-1,4-benzoquinol methylase